MKILLQNSCQLLSSVRGPFLFASAMKIESGDSRLRNNFCLVFTMIQDNISEP